jgi:hypothetical protein
MERLSPRQTSPAFILGSKQIMGQAGRQKGALKGAPFSFDLYHPTQRLIADLSPLPEA